MQDALGAAADEITRELAPGSVELRIRDRNPEFVVTLAPDELMAAAEAYALKLLEKSQVALHSIKETVNSVVGKSLDEALKLEAIFGYSSGDVEFIAKQLESFSAKTPKRT